MTNPAYQPDLAERMAIACYNFNLARGTGCGPWEELTEGQRLAAIKQAEMWLLVYFWTVEQELPQPTDLAITQKPRPRRRKKGTPND